MEGGSKRLERRLAAIFAADVEGYSQLMGLDEVGTLRTLTAHREIMDRLIEEHGGRIANTAGDSVLAEFPSVVDAVQAAVEVQKKLEEANETLAEDRQVRFRIGVHVGDVMVKGGDLFGGGVNIAARLQAIAEPGGVCISGDAHQYVRRTLPLTFTDLGQQKVKNIEEGVRAYATRLRVTSALACQPTEPKPLPVPDKPSIAVLPFTNMSGDPEQDYFCDGLVEDIITSLSRFPSLFVTARSSSFTYKGRSVDVKQIGRELSVRYILGGSIRKAGNQVRVTGQLLDAVSGHHLWADHFDSDLSESIFALQDAITATVVGVIQPAIQQAEIDAAVRKRPTSLSAYDLYLRALPGLHRMTREGLNEALELLYRALELDPKYSAAAALASSIRGYRRAAGIAPCTPEDIAEQLRLTKLAVDADPNDLDVLGHAARQLGYMGADFDSAMEMTDRATMLYPNSAFAWDQRGWVCMYCARPAEAVQSFHKAIRLSPRDPMQYDMLCGMAFALIQLGRYDEAAETARRSLRLNSNFSSTLRALVAALAHLERMQEAHDATAHLLRLEPAFRITEWDRRSPWKYPAKEKMIAGLRKAGLPE